MGLMVAFYKEFLFSSSIFEGNYRIFLHPGCAGYAGYAGYAAMNIGGRTFAHKKRETRAVF